jgi:O-antigen/teichoic acid export membrane protein
MPELPRRFRRSVLTSYANTATTALVALVMTPVLVHGLGTEAYGIWVLAGSLALYLELLEFGFGLATVKYAAEYSSLDDRQGLHRVLATSFWILTVPGVVALLIGGGIALGFSHIFSTPPDLVDAAAIVVLLVAFDLALSIPSDTFGGALMGLQRFDLVNGTLIAVLAAQAVSWFLVLESGGGLVEIAIVTVALSLLGQLSRYLLARRLIPGLSVSLRYFDRQLVRPLAGLSVWLAVSQASLLVIQRLDVVVVGIVLGVRAAAIYAVGQKLAFAVERFVMPTVKMFFPWSSELSARADEVGLRSSLLTGTRLSLAVGGPLCLALILLAGPVLEAWLGSGFEDAELVVVFLAAATVAAALGRTGTLMLQGAGQARPTAWMALFEATLNVTLAIVLAHLVGLSGVALATLIAASTANLGLAIPYACRRFGVSPGVLLRSLAQAHALPIAAGLGVGWLVLRGDPAGIPSVLASGTAVVAAYVVVFGFTGLERGERAVLRARWRLLARRASG